MSLRPCAPEELAAIAKEALSHEYESRADDPPETADDMTLGELVAVVMHGASWKHFKQTLGDNRQTAQTHLADLPRLRNDLFHFRRELEPEELAQIQAASEWLRLRVRASGLMQGADE